MFEKIKRLFTETAIYGASTIVGRLLNFLLVPFYTNILLPNEYGISAYIFSLIGLVGMLYGFGLESAFFKYASNKDEKSASQTFSTAFFSIFISSTILSLAIYFLGEQILTLISVDKIFLPSIYLAAITLAFDSFAIIPFASLRLQHKAVYFATVKILNIVITILSNIYFLIILDYGVNGIFMSSAIASVSTVVLLLPVLLKEFKFKIELPLLEQLWKYGVPLIPAGIATVSLQIIDRPILKFLTNDATVGIYQANYRLGIFMMLIVQMFDFAWRPFYFSISKEEEAKKIISRIMIYISVGLAFVFLLISFFITDIVTFKIMGRTIIHQNYWSGLLIVPIILLSYLFFGLSNIFSAGLYIEKKTHLVPIGSFIASGFKIVLTLTLVPIMGIFGAAFATLTAYFSLAVTMLVLSQKVYPIKYEWPRFVKIALITFLIFMLYILFGQYTGNIFTLKVILIFSFFPLLYFVKFFEKEEKSRLKKIFIAKS